MLTSYNGNAITYDGSGNPLSMNGWNYTWQGGRQLAGMTNGTTTLSFEYNDSGLRTTKTVGDVTHTYYYHGSTLVADITDAYGLYFHYNANGSPVGLTYDIYGETTSSAKYYYIKNLQGDIIGIMHSSGDLVASYTYDAWGNVLSADDHEDDSGLCNRNPLRYRGYYYDTETELYYLQSRYYNPGIGRFINADGLVSTDQGHWGYNLFLYCNNNPISYSDPNGYRHEMHAGVLGTMTHYLVGRQSPDYYFNGIWWHNCYSYAFGLRYGDNPGNYYANACNSTYLYSDKTIYTVDELTELVLKDMGVLNISVRVVSSPSERLNNEYIVAMKTSSQLNPQTGWADYHFAVQLNDGTWADKRGATHSRWNKIDGSAAAWDLSFVNGPPIKGYYDSETVYFAVRR